MNAFESSTTVQPLGEIRVPGVPFAPGTEVEVTIVPKRKSPDEFNAAWERVCSELRTSVGEQNLTEDDLQREIDDYRAGR
jgi:hypothetical protein